MLKREDSNKILKKVKVMLSAASLPILTQVNVNAEQVTANIVNSSKQVDSKLVVGNVLLFAGIVSIACIREYNKYLIQKLKDFDSLESVDIDNDFDNEIKARKELKIICK